MTAYVTNVKIISGYAREAHIEIVADRWTSDRAKFSDLPDDMQEVLRKWIEADQ